ncbi:hypothetical protein EDB89DRAFT_1904238 [Lactarius sanguifluus]|nr:hypothetical protein EDB89DRAFT_1904238 [Lactarius sanguifluus]
MVEYGRPGVVENSRRGTGQLLARDSGAKYLNRSQVAEGALFAKRRKRQVESVTSGLRQVDSLRDWTWSVRNFRAGLGPPTGAVEYCASLHNGTFERHLIIVSNGNNACNCAAVDHVIGMTAPQSNRNNCRSGTTAPQSRRWGGPCGISGPDLGSTSFGMMGVRIFSESGYPFHLIRYGTPFLLGDTLDLQDRFNFLALVLSLDDFGRWSGEVHAMVTLGLPGYSGVEHHTDFFVICLRGLGFVVARGDTRCWGSLVWFGLRPFLPNWKPN